MSGFIKVLLLSMAAICVTSCHRSSGLIIDEGHTLIRIQLPQPEEAIVDRADVKLRCIDCEPNQAQERNLVNVDVDVEQIPVAFVNEKLARYRYTRGSLLSVDVTYYVDGEVALWTCAKSTADCRSKIFVVQGSSAMMELELRFEVARSGTIPNLESDPDPGRESNPINLDILLTKTRQESIANGLCLGELGENGESLGIIPGQSFSEVCMVPYGNQIHLISSSNVHYISRQNFARFDIGWVAAISLEANPDPEAYRPLLAGGPNQDENIPSLYACRDLSANRYGLTTIRNDGNNHQIAADCFVTTDTQGNPASTVQRISNFEVLSYRERLGRASIDPR